MTDDVSYDDILNALDRETWRSCLEVCLILGTEDVDEVRATLEQLVAGQRVRSINGGGPVWKTKYRLSHWRR